MREFWLKNIFKDIESIFRTRALKWVHIVKKIRLSGDKKKLSSLLTTQYLTHSLGGEQLLHLLDGGGELCDGIWEGLVAGSEGGEAVSGIALPPRKLAPALHHVHGLVCGSLRTRALVLHSDKQRSNILIYFYHSIAKW